MYNEEKKNTECTKKDLTEEQAEVVNGGAKRGEPRTDSGETEEGILLPEI